MPGEKPDVLLMGTKKPVIVGGLTNAVNLHPLEDAKDKDAFLKFHRGQGARDRGVADRAQDRRRPDAAVPEARARLDLRRRLRPCRCEVGRRTWHHRDQHPRRPQRRGCRHRAWPAALDGARTAAGRALPPRGQMAVWQLSADQHAARPHRRHGGHGANRPGHRAAHRGVRRAGRLSQPHPASGREVQVLSEADRHGARRRHADGHRARRAGDTEHHQQGSARGARAHAAS